MLTRHPTFFRIATEQPPQPENADSSSMFDYSPPYRWLGHHRDLNLDLACNGDQVGSRKAVRYKTEETGRWVEGCQGRWDWGCPGWFERTVSQSGFVWDSWTGCRRTRTRAEVGLVAVAANCSLRTHHLCSDRWTSERVNSSTPTHPRHLPHTLSSRLHPSASTPTRSPTPDSRKTPKGNETESVWSPSLLTRRCERAVPPPHQKKARRT
jgi:hypothetical protein